MLIGENVSLGDLDDLGLKVGGKPISYGREYWIVDAEGGTNYVVAKANCMPFQVAPGYRAQMPGPFPVSKGPMAKRPGPWPETVSGLGQSYVRNQYFEVLSPGGGVIASFRCRPFYTEPSFAVKLVTQTGGGQEELIKQGAAMFPTGTVRRRTRGLYTVKRGP